MPVPPQSVDTGAVVLQIEIVPKLTDSTDKKRLMGHIRHSLSRIQLDTESEVQAMATTLIHELLHYYIVEHGQESAIHPDRMEELIAALATGTITLIRRNPDLITFIQELDDVSR